MSTKREMLVYLSGKITGLPDLNKPKFRAAQMLLVKELKDLEHKHIYVFNPHDLPDDHDKSWGSYMRECIKTLSVCERTYVLDDWKKSKGALTEVLISKILNMPVIEVETFKPITTPYLEIFARLLVKLK